VKRLFVCAIVAIAACASPATSSHGGPTAPSPRRTDARATVSDTRLTIQFPSHALANAGCVDLDTTASGVLRRYRWHAVTSSEGSEHSSTHFMGIYVFFRLPEAMPLTPARLDSALASLTLTVNEAGGEPAHDDSHHPAAAGQSMVDRPASPVAGG
jgi:hypothetical protein